MGSGCHEENSVLQAVGPGLSELVPPQMFPACVFPGEGIGWVLPIEGCREQPARGYCRAVKVNSVQ